VPVSLTIAVRNGDTDARLAGCAGCALESSVSEVRRIN
jgi:hypothetical protein